jgi:hypothetical protein
MKKTAIVQLGRFGDIANILPVAKKVRDIDGQNPAFIVSKNYASILDGVSYVDPVSVDCDFADIHRGINVARLHGEAVLISQVYGWNYSYKQEMDAFNVESWYRAGFLPEWNQLPLIFDRRNADREQDLRNFFRIHDDQRPVLLVNFGGTSSPYPMAGRLNALVKEQLTEYQIIDLTPAKCERVYDLLGLMDVAHGLITIDTATLHLAAACPKMSVFALTTDTPTLWHGARPPLNTAISMRYRESQHRMDQIVEALKSGALLNREN